jgi:hypothetical protein
VPLYTDIFVELWGVGLLRDNKDIVNGVWHCENKYTQGDILILLNSVF